MITLVKVNVITDDETLPVELKEKLVEVLQTFFEDDPEGPEHAKVTLEWKHQIHNRDYMKSLQTRMGAEQIQRPKKKAAAGKR
jgi:hypothetical protein